MIEMITEFPLFVFTTLVGIAAGAYVFAALFPNKETPAKPWLFPLVMLIIAAVGSIASMTHVGRPALIFGIFANPTSSLTLEALFAGLLCLVALIDCIICFVKKADNRAVRIVGAIAGIVLMLIVTMAYTSSYGNPAWTAAPTWLLMLLGGLAAGAGLWALFNKDALATKSYGIAVCVISALFAVVLVWQAAVFAGLGEAVAPIVIGAIAAAAAAIIAIMASRGKLASASMALFIVALIAIVVSRYGFYMASII